MGGGSVLVLLLLPLRKVGAWDVLSFSEIVHMITVHIVSILVIVYWRTEWNSYFLY